MHLARTLFPLAAILLLASGARAAGGVSLRWHQCFGDGGVPNRNFACDSNAGSQTLVASFTLGADLAQVSGNEVVIDLASASPTLPAWWGFKNAGTCRTTSLAVEVMPLVPSLNCPDWTSGLAAGGLGAYVIGFRSPATARVLVVTGVPATEVVDLVAGQEYFSCSLKIANDKTVGAGSCAGCFTPVCLVLHSLNVTTPIQSNNVLLSGPTNNSTDSDWAMWQRGPVTLLDCPAATPTARTTWSGLKSLYR